MTFMQAVILAAGRGERVYPFTGEINKCMIKIGNKPVLEHTIEQLPFYIRKIILVIRPGDEELKKYFGKRYGFKKIIYIEQKSPKGTADALLQAKSILKRWFVVLNGDVFYKKKDIKRCVRRRPCMLVTKVEKPEHYGVVTVNKKRVSSLVEKPKKADSNLINAGLYVLKKDMIEKKLKKSSHGEYEIVDFFQPLISQNKLRYAKTDFFATINYSWDILNENKKILSQIKLKQKGEVEINSTLKGKVGIGRGTILKNGSYLEGPVVIGKNCSIGPNCYIRGPTSIGDNCKIGHSVEIKASVIFSGTSIGHLAYIGDSIVGRNVNIGAGTTTANLRHNGETIKVKLHGGLVDTGLKKFGAIIGNSVHTGINTTIYPGRIVDRNTLPGEIVKK